MKKSEILSELKKLKFTVFWPGDWADIGFTERPIWINSLGYGYYSDDEPCFFETITNVSDKDIEKLKRRIETNGITLLEIEKSPFNIGGICDEEEVFDNRIKEFLRIPNHIKENIFCGESYDGLHFYSSEEEMLDAFDPKDNFNGGEKWEDLDAKTLKIWYKRITNEIKNEHIIPRTIEIIE